MSRFYINAKISSEVLMQFLVINNRVMKMVDEGRKSGWFEHLIDLFCVISLFKVEITDEFTLG
jgi:hypothetical protein